MWFIHFDVPCNYLNLFLKRPAANFFNVCCFLAYGHVGHCTNKFTEIGLDLFIKYLLRAFNVDFAAAKASLDVIISSSSGGGGGGGGDDGSGIDGTSSCGSSSKILT